MAMEFVPYTGEVVTRAEAKARGLTRFFTGKPCKHGHLSERTTCNGGCIRCNAISIAALYYGESPEKRALRNARQKARKDANREQVRAEGRKYSKEHRQESSAYKAANRDKLNAAEREARKRNPETYKASAIRYRETPKGLASVKTSSHNRRARLQCVDGFYGAADILCIGERQKWKCHWCHKPTGRQYHVDHLIPLAKGGTNWPSNIVIACPACNQRKNATDPIEYARRIGLLI